MQVRVLQLKQKGVEGLEGKVQTLCRQGARHLVVNLQQVKSLLGIEIEALVNGREACRDAGGDLVYSHMKPGIQTVLKIMEIEDRFTIYADDARALEALRQGAAGRGARLDASPPTVLGPEDVAALPAAEADAQTEEILELSQDAIVAIVEAAPVGAVQLDVPEDEEEPVFELGEEAIVVAASEALAPVDLPSRPSSDDSDDDEVLDIPSDAIVKPAATQTAFLELDAINKAVEAAKPAPRTRPPAVVAAAAARDQEETEELRPEDLIGEAQVTVGRPFRLDLDESSDIAAPVHDDRKGEDDESTDEVAAAFAETMKAQLSSQEETHDDGFKRQEDEKLTDRLPVVFDREEQEESVPAAASEPDEISAAALADDSLADEFIVRSETAREVVAPAGPVAPAKPAAPPRPEPSVAVLREDSISGPRSGTPYGPPPAEPLSSSLVDLDDETEASLKKEAESVYFDNLGGEEGGAILELTESSVVQGLPASRALHDGSDEIDGASVSARDLERAILDNADLVTARASAGTAAPTPAAKAATKAAPTATAASIAPAASITSEPSPSVGAPKVAPVSPFAHRPALARPARGGGLVRRLAGAAALLLLLASGGWAYVHFRSPSLESSVLAKLDASVPSLVAWYRAQVLSIGREPAEEPVVVEPKPEPKPLDLPPDLERGLAREAFQALYRDALKLGLAPAASGSEGR